MPDRRRNVRDLERKARRGAEALEALLHPSGVPKRGTVLADLLERAKHRAVPDGFPTNSWHAAPALSRPSIQDGLRTTPEDALRRKREPGYAEGSSVEKAVESLLNDVCEKCEGRGVDLRFDPSPACDQCSGSGRRFNDPISAAVDALVDALEDVVRLCRLIDKKRQIVLHARDAAPTEAAARNCRGCHRKVYGAPMDPIRRALCGACSVAYGRWRVDNGTDDESADRVRFCARRNRHEDHVESLCDQCAEEKRRAGDDWKFDPDRRDHTFERLGELQRRGELPTKRGAA